MGPIGAKRGQMVPNDAKQSQTGPNGVKRAKTRTKRALRGKTLPNGPNEAKWGQLGLIFCMHSYFYEVKKLRDVQQEREVAILLQVLYNQFYRRKLLK